MEGSRVPSTAPPTGPQGVLRGKVFDIWGGDGVCVIKTARSFTFLNLNVKLSLFFFFFYHNDTIPSVSLP